MCDVFSPSKEIERELTQFGMKKKTISNSFINMTMMEMSIN